MASRLSGYVQERKKNGAVSPACTARGGGGDGGGGAGVCLLEAGPSSSSSSSRETSQLGLWGADHGNADGGSWATYPGDHPQPVPETVPVS